MPVVSNNINTISFITYFPLLLIHCSSNTIISETPNTATISVALCNISSSIFYKFFVSCKVIQYTFIRSVLFKYFLDLFMLIFIGKPFVCMFFIKYNDCVTMSFCSFPSNGNHIICISPTYSSNIR